MMTQAMRAPTLESLGLGRPLDAVRTGALPIDAPTAVERVFGPESDRGSLVISGANGIVGAGKVMQLGSRLVTYGVRIVALDLPGSLDGVGRHYPGLARSFGGEAAARIMANVVRLSYDGATLPEELDRLRPRLLIEAIPEVLSLKRSHYAMFRARFPDLDIRSVTSGFPSALLGVPIAHPAFPHEVNKVWEVVEPEPSATTQLLWALGLIPVPVSDHWSFVLDVLFCGLTLAALRYHGASNTPFWRVDKLVRRHIGPNPIRAHDAIGARGANYLTWSCLHHLAQHYGPLFEPTPELVERKESGQEWYPPGHFRPLVNWSLHPDDESEMRAWIHGPLFQMACLMVHERRSALPIVNAIGESCAQFQRGLLAMMRSLGPDAVIATVDAYHRCHPDARQSPWHPEALAAMELSEWQQLYVNAEHDGTVGVVTISRESYNGDVDRELNRAIDWLKQAGIDRVIVSGDFHLSTQMVGADTREFFPALSDAEVGIRISRDWSRTARRLDAEFAASVGLVTGKRCLGGMLELLTHCHYLVAADQAELGMPEVTLPVVPGMEGCHWPLRKADPAQRPNLLRLLLTGHPVPAASTVRWLVDYAGPLPSAMKQAWTLATRAVPDHGRRAVERGALAAESLEPPRLEAPGSTGQEHGRRAILGCVRDACLRPVDEALDVQSRHSGEFMTSEACRAGRIGTEFARIVSP